MESKFDKVRESVMKKVGELFGKMEYDVLRTGSQELCIPIIGEDNEEGYLVVTFKVPKGSRDGDIYVYLDKRNGYYNFYYDTPWYLEDSVTISYYANKKYKTLPKLYRLDKLSDNVIIEIARKNADSYLKIKTRKFDIWKVV